MRCAWREIASYIDVWWPLLFFGFWLFMLWGFFAVELPWRRAQNQSWWWWGGWRRLTRAENRKYKQWLRDTGRGWVLRTGRIALAAILFVLIWPLVSPTFCENVKCAGYKGLKPRTECLPQGVSRRCQTLWV